MYSLIDIDNEENKKAKEVKMLLKTYNIDNILMICLMKK